MTGGAPPVLPADGGPGTGPGEPFAGMVLAHVPGVVLYSVDGVVRWVSPGVVALLGWEPGELTGGTLTHLWHPDDRAAALALRADVNAGQHRLAVLRIRHRHGHHLSVEVAVTPHREDDGSPGAVTSMRDVTGQVLAERALARSEEQYRLLAENAADIVFRSSPLGVLEWVSPSFRTVLGFPEDDVVGMPVSAIIHPDDAPRLAAATARVVAGQPVGYEARYRRADGEYVWLGLTVRPVLADDGTVVGRVGGARVIQAEVEARTARRESEALIASAIQSAAIGFALVDADGLFTMVNPALARMLQRDEAWLLDRGPGDVLHPEDVAAAAGDRAWLLRRGHGVRTRDLRFVRADGSLMWSRRTAVLVADPDGTRPASVLLEIEDVTAEREARERLTYREFHDPLTGLRNRSWMLDVLATELGAEAHEGQLPVGVLVADVDGFRLVNDSVSHAAGDALLVEVGARIAAAAAPADHVGRYGADEFLVVVPGVVDPIELERVADALCAAVATPLVVDGQVLHPSVSLGIAVASRGTTADAALRDADLALDRAKRQARGRWHFADEAMHTEAVRRLTLEQEIRCALPAGQFVVHYQPVVELPGGAVVGHEALVRWAHPRRGLLPPAEFLPVAEESGLVVDLGDGVLDQVCALLASRPDLPGHVAVNVSGVQLARPGWVDVVQRALDRHAVDPHRLVLEVTETAVLAVEQPTVAALGRLRAAGVGLHVDDFGTGFSSIALLRDLPVSGLKLDRRFVRDLTSHDSAANALAAGLAGLAAGLGLLGIAEGVETPDQARTLAGLGWPLGQGYWFGRPAAEPRTA